MRLRNFGKALLIMTMSAIIDMPLHAAVVKVCGQNLQNYYWNYDQTMRTQTNSVPASNYTSDDGRAEKTRRIVNAMLRVDADIYAFNELEATEIILKQLADSMTLYGNAKYAHVSDGISYVVDTFDNHLKSGFIYRTDRIKTVGVNYAGATSSYYSNTMRIQTFEEISSGERFTLSINHFKSGSTESDEQTRVNNATQLLTALSKNTLDEDILIMGDMNCEYGAESLTKIVDAGYEEQLLKYGGMWIYSHCYNDGSLIDHVFANSSMAQQVVDAQIFHLSTTCRGDNEMTAYSDHDPYLVTLNLSSSSQSHECEPLDYMEDFVTSIGIWTHTETVSGGGYWGYYSKNSCVYASGYNKSGVSDSWLISPEFDMRGFSSAKLSMLLRISYGTPSNYAQNVRLYVTDQYSTPLTTVWTPITGLQFTNWNGKQNDLQVPAEMLGKEHVVFALRYSTTDTSGDAPNVGMNNFKLTGTCGSAGVAEVYSEPEHSLRPVKVIENGQFYILMPDGTKYSVCGTRVE